MRRANLNEGFGYFYAALGALAHESKLSTLRSERDRLDAGNMSGTELRVTEHDFLGTDVPFGSGLHAAPLGLGGALAFVPAFGKQYTKQEQTTAAITGSVLILSSVLTLLAPNLVPHYKNSLSTSGLSLLASPANVGFRYRF